MGTKINPRWKTGRRKNYQARLRALGLPCALCGRAIDYSLPYYIKDEEGRKHVNLAAFCIDEKIPVSKWQEGGYSSPADCANDFNNLQPAHVLCNLRKGNRTNFSMRMGMSQDQQQTQGQQHRRIKIDGQW